MKRLSLGGGIAVGFVLSLALGSPAMGAEEKGGGSVQSLNGLKGKLNLAGGLGTSIAKTNRKTLTITGLTFPYSAPVSTTLPSFQVTNNVPAGHSSIAIKAEVKGYGTAIDATDNTGLPSGCALRAYSGCGYALDAWGNVGVYGNVDLSGTLSKGAGSFKIDHPLDPENKYLYHSFVESPDMMNIYNGNAVLDENGEATIEMPEWFGALNRDFRYQLTCIGGFAPVYIAERMHGNRFKIAGGQAGLEVSWQVTGIRKDPFANAHRIPVEEEKPDEERGYYLHPREAGQPEELGILWRQRSDSVR
ncbi:MAG: hypothetical protein AB1714_23855 [Acidobacteriota bacterium]